MMRRLAHFACTLLLAGPVLLPACGGQTKDSTTFSSGLPPEQRLSGLNESDQTRLCTGLIGYLRDNKDVICKVTGYVTASLETSFGSSETNATVQSKCTESIAKCESQGPLFAGPSSCKPLDISAGCGATVRDYESCLTEELMQLHDFASRLPTCSELTPAYFDAQATTHTDKVELGSGPACKALQARCPGQFKGGVIGGESSSTGSTDVGGSSTTSLPDAGTFPARCGNGVIDPGEECDSVNLNGQTCVSVTMGAHPTGVLKCQSTCQFDISGCI